MLPARDRGCEQCTNAQRECLKPNMPTEMVEMMIIAVVVDIMLMLMLMVTLRMTFLRRYDSEPLNLFALICTFSARTAMGWRESRSV